MPKLKAFNKSEKEKIKKVILGIPILLTVIAIVIVASSYAIFQRQDEAQLIRATVGNFNNKGDILLAITVNGKEVDVPPSKNKYTVTVDCDNATGTWDSDRWGANIDNITTTNVKCNINFETPKPTLTEVTATSEKTSINLSYTAEGAGTTTTCKYGIESGSYTNTATGATNTTCSITGLSAGTIYYYQVCAMNIAGETCKEGNIKTKTLADEVQIGDYIQMTPTAASYTIPASTTGYTSAQTINPSELNLWRVIKKNDDGTVEAVSHYVSSTKVYFSGQTGYMNFVGGLNEIAAQYTDAKYVQSTRHMGYSNQIEKCTSFSSSSCPTDTGYETDKTLVQVAIGELRGPLPGGGISEYWIASRKLAIASSGVSSTTASVYYYSNGAGYFVNTSLYQSRGSSSQSNSATFSVRPILTFKKEIVIASGDGTADSPYKLS